MRKMLMAALFALAAMPAAAQQLQVSFISQPAAVTNKITGGIPSLKGIKIYQVALCNTNTSTISIHSGAVYMAAQKLKIATVGPAAAQFIFNRLPTRHPAALALDLAQYASFAISVLSSADTVKLTSNFRALLPLLGPAFKAAGDKLQTVQPDFSSLAKALLDGQMALPPSVCSDNLMFATAGPDDPVFGEIAGVSIAQQPQAPTVSFTAPLNAPAKP